MVTTALTLGVVLSPLLRPDHDSYPLSTYPMFSTPIGRESALPTAVGRRDDGAIVRLSPELISGGFEPVRAFAVVARAISGADTESLCREIAARVADSSGRVAAVTSVEVVTERHDVVGYFAGDEEPRQRDVHAQCAVERSR